MITVYKRIQGGSEGHIEGITGNHDKYFSRHMESVFISEGAEMYILVAPDDPKQARWEHPEAGLVDLWNTHGSGELRWKERDYSWLSHHALDAVKYFKLAAALIDTYDWSKILAAYDVKLEDLEEIDIKLLSEANHDRDGMGRIRYGRDERSEEVSRLYDLQNKGLVNIGSSASGPNGCSQGYYITHKGRSVLGKGFDEAR